MRAWLAALMLLGACASPQATPPATPASPPAPTPPQTPSQSQSPTQSPPPSTPPQPPPPPPEPPQAFKDALDAAAQAIASGDYAKADRAIDAASAAAGDDGHLHYLVARYRATRFAYAGDFERAASAFVAVMPALAKRPDVPDEFWAHNTMMMLREAQGDPAAALAENDQATIAAARGAWEPAERAKLALFKDRWHRAYLTRMLAESRAGSVKAALVAYARAALEDYRAAGGYGDSIAVLEAYFAALDGRREDALAAAKKVDPAKDDDVEDLYLVVVGLEAGGDHAAAEAVKKVMRQPGRPHVARAVMLRWLDLDAKPGSPRGFTPWHATRR